MAELWLNYGWLTYELCPGGDEMTREVATAEVEVLDEDMLLQRIIK